MPDRTTSPATGRIDFLAMPHLRPALQVLVSAVAVFGGCVAGRAGGPAAGGRPAGAPIAHPTPAPVPPALTAEALARRVAAEGLSFDATEALAVAAGLAPRRSAERRIAPEAFRFDDDATREIAASVFSLSEAFFSGDDARRFVAAVQAHAPAREILVLADPPIAGALAGLPRVSPLPTFGRPFSPWPRDPMSLVRRPDGGFAVLLRPNRQRGREADVDLGRALVQTLPDDLDRRFGRLVWTTAALPFHNGQVLLTADAAWITLHTLEPQVLARLGVDRVPVESFATAAGIERYLAAARAAADELGALYGRPVRFVHPLPDAGGLEQRMAAMQTIGGAAGVDLDSIVTLLPGAQPAALVGDLSAGAELVNALAPEELAAFVAAYDLAPGAATGALAGALASPPAQALDRFLDAAAEHLAAAGFAVARLPLLRVPYALLADPSGLPPSGSFLVGWNNAVLETRAGERFAESFASHLPRGDRLAREAYARLGVHLALHPPLVRSVILGGGYRCASNHLRR